jgi:hypothetical protein
MALSQVDFDIIDTRVRAEQRSKKWKTKSIAFLALAMRQYFPSIEDELIESITDGPDDRGVDGVRIVEGESSTDIYVFQSKYRDEISGTARTFNESEILKIQLFLTQLFERSPELEKCGNVNLQVAIKRIWQLHKDGKICRYHIVLTSNSEYLSPSGRAIVGSITSSNEQVRFEFFGPKDFISAISLENHFKESGSLQVVGKEILERSDGDIRGVIASIDARSFIELISTSDKTGVKRHLFEENLRVFLGAKGGYNEQIIESASRSDSYLFWYLNNGITITCKNFSYNKGHSNPTLQIDEFQIVNGAQTSHSLFAAFQNNSSAFDDLVLMVRVYATDRQDIAERVAVATNSQARIQGRDLRANHSAMKSLELAFRQRGYHFERKKGMFADKKEELRIDALKLGQIIFAYHLHEPEKSKSESDTIFGQRFSEIFHTAYDIDQLLSVFEMYRKIEVLREDYIRDFGNAPESGHQHQYLVYGHWFILYACSLLLGHRDEKVIPKGEVADELVADAIGLVARACAQQKAVAHYQMFRSGKTKYKIIGELLGRQLDLFELFDLEPSNR